MFDKKIRILAVSIVILLNISLVGVVGAEKSELSTNTAQEFKISDKQNENMIIQENPSSKKIQINLSENIGIRSDNDPSNISEVKNNDQSIITNSYSSYTEINLSDKITIFDNPQGQNVILLLTPNSDKLTTLDKIPNTERNRYNGRIMKITNENIDQY